MKISKGFLFTTCALVCLQASSLVQAGSLSPLPQEVPIQREVTTPSYSNQEVNSYPTGQCTWGSKVLAPWAGDYWGNAGQWAQSAQLAGFSVGSIPKPGAIACWQDGSYGHVAFVVAVEHDQRIQVEESNYNNQLYIANFRGWFDPTVPYLGSVSYIYPPNLS